MKDDEDVWTTTSGPGCTVLLKNGVPAAQGDIATIKLNPGYWKTPQFKDAEQ